MQRMTIDLSDEGNKLLEYAIEWLTAKDKLPSKVSRAHAITKALLAPHCMVAHLARGWCYVV